VKPPAPLPDAEARRRIAEDLDHSLVVTAGAGTGKTSALVGRVVELVRRGAPLREVAVITFTEAAAAELRARLSEELAQASAADPAHAGLRAALAEVDEAAVCTLHAFAQRMLAEHVLAAGLPPGFEVLDELSERVDLEGRLARFTDDLLDDPDAEPLLLRGFALGMKEDAFAELAWCLHRHWDRLDAGGLELLDAARVPGGRWPEVDATPVLQAMDAALDMAVWCTEESDLLLRHVEETLRRARSALEVAAGDAQTAAAVLVRIGKLSCGYGQAQNWGGRAADVRAACAAAEEARQGAIEAVRGPVLAELVARLAAFTLSAAAQRAEEGRLSFHDLLVRARRLLRDDAGARAALRRRYRWLLVDEFQDTDPLQVDLAAWLSCAVEGAGDLAQARPGAVFVVGDPKQSIYRFRRADITLFEEVCAKVGDEVELSSSFRSVPGVVRFVNTVFPLLFGEDPTPGQARYHALEAQRPPLAGEVRRGGVQLTLAGMGEEAEPPGLGLPPVVVLGGGVEGSVGETRRVAATDIAAAVRRAVAESWPASSPDDPAAPPRALRYCDVAVLIPTRNTLPALEEAFDAADVPYRLEGAALLWGSDEVRDVLCALAAADEPSDAVSVLTALRSPGFACGDDDLVAWRSAGGSWDPRAAVPAGLEDQPVARAMAILLELHRKRWWTGPSEMVAAAVERLGSLELAFAHRRPRQHWQRLRWLADQARLFDETAGGSLHDFLRWSELQREGDGRAAILGPPESDDDSVRVMTVHGAKGLEFPMVVVAGLERDESAGRRADAVLWREDGGVEVSLNAELRSPGWVEASRVDRELDRLERVRLLYVAMTRARDHLVLCLHHRTRSGQGDASPAAQLEELCRLHPLLWRRLPETQFEGAGGAGGALSESERRVLDRAALDRATLERVFPGIGGAAAGDDAELRQIAEELEGWSRERSSLLARLRTFPVATASTLGHGPLVHGPGLAPDDTVEDGHLGGADPLGGAVAGGRWRPDVALEIGRAVHGTLAQVDLGTHCDAGGRPASEAARLRAIAHGVPEHADAVGAMVARALAAPVVQRAAGLPHHKELWLSMALGTEDGDGIFEGFADLVVEDEDGLVVVDYKTDRLPDDAALASLFERYALQVAAYAEAAAAATGRPAVRCVLVFVGGTEPVERVLEGEQLATARRSAGQAMRSLESASR
jgi:ATP-dependent exoDNAse (exonuclease V) beta subunit